MWIVVCDSQYCIADSIIVDGIVLSLSRHTCGCTGFFRLVGRSSTDPVVSFGVREDDLLSCSRCAINIRYSVDNSDVVDAHALTRHHPQSRC